MALEEVSGVNPVQPCELLKLHDVDPPFAALDFREERLGFPELSCDLSLGEARSPTRGP